jgi:hypothetical protein
VRARRQPLDGTGAVPIPPENRYDIVDRTGRLVRGVTLPENQRLVGVGRSGAYVAETDEDGIQRLRRHPWP